MKKYLLIVFMAFAQCYAFGQGKIVFEKKSIDLGDVDTSKKPLKAVFKFKNEGNEPLTINTVSGDSKFTFNYPKTPIAPGQEGVITVEGQSYSGSFKKTITVISSGLNSITRVFLSYNNDNTEPYNPTVKKKDMLVQGGDFKDWLYTNLKKNLTGINNKITYIVKIEFEIDGKGKIAKANYVKDNLPQSIINEIVRLVKISPTFTADYYGKKIKESIRINNYHYSNPNDKAYDIVLEGIDKNLSRQVNASVENLSAQDLAYYLRIPVTFIIEKDGSITNLMSIIFSDSSADYVNKVNEAINKVARVGKTKPGIADGKKCRTIYQITVLVHR